MVYAMGPGDAPDLPQTGSAQNNWKILGPGGGPAPFRTGNNHKTVEIPTPKPYIVFKNLENGWNPYP